MLAVEEDGSWLFARMVFGRTSQIGSKEGLGEDDQDYDSGSIGVDIDILRTK